LHCPTAIYEGVIEDAAASADRRQNAVLAKDNKDRESARLCLFEQFPHIPRDTAEEILEHAFVKHSRRVGRSTKLDDEINIELAVNAHIRHRHTDYDTHYQQSKAYRTRPEVKMEARNRVYDQVKEIADSWRIDSTVKSDTRSFRLRPTANAKTQDRRKERLSSQIAAPQHHEQPIETILGRLELNTDATKKWRRQRKNQARKARKARRYMAHSSRDDLESVFRRIQIKNTDDSIAESGARKVNEAEIPLVNVCSAPAAGIADEAQRPYIRVRSGLTWSISPAKTPR